MNCCLVTAAVRDRCWTLTLCRHCYEAKPSMGQHYHLWMPVVFHSVPFSDDAYSECVSGFRVHASTFLLSRTSLSIVACSCSTFQGLWLLRKRECLFCPGEGCGPSLTGEDGRLRNLLVRAKPTSDLISILCCNTKPVKTGPSGYIDVKGLCTF